GTRRGDVAALDLAGGARQVLPAALEHVGGIARARAAAEQRDLQRGGEIVGDALLVALGRGAEQPHQQEEGHHRRHEVGVSDLPGAAMVAMAALLDLLDDDRLELLAVAGHGSVLHQAFLPLTWPSSSAKVGRSVEYSTLRPNSTATCGA